jgi:type III secretion protein U
VSDKTEEATPKRLRKAREDGDSGASAFAAQAVAFAVAVAIVPAAVRAVASHAADDLRGAIARAATVNMTCAPGDVCVGHGVPLDAAALATTVVALVAPLLLAAGLAGAIVHVVQTGGVVATKRLTPKLERLNPFAGVKGFFSAARLFSVVRALLAGLVVGWLAWRGLADHLVDLAHLGGQPLWTPSLVADVAGALAWRAALVGLALGVVDVVVTRGTWRRRLRMSKDEVKREHKESEGDPQTKAARERAYHELLAQATVANVRTASVVVVNPTHLACALRYLENEGDDAPVVVASGEGDLAQRIVRAAEEYGVPVVRDVPLARALIELQVGEVIPEALYEAVAEILREIAEGEPPTPPSPGPGPGTAAPG